MSVKGKLPTLKEKIEAKAKAEEAKKVKPKEVKVVRKVKSKRR